MKSIYDKSELREWADGQACTIRLAPGLICRNRTDTTILCHPQDIEKMIKGTGFKFPDFLGAIGCFECHEVIDGRRQTKFTKEYIENAFWRGHAETTVMAFTEGLIKYAI